MDWGRLSTLKWKVRNTRFVRTTNAFYMNYPPFYDRRILWSWLIRRSMSTMTPFGFDFIYKLNKILFGWIWVVSRPNAFVKTNDTKVIYMYLCKIKYSHNLHVVVMNNEKPFTVLTSWSLRRLMRYIPISVMQSRQRTSFIQSYLPPLHFTHVTVEFFFMFS